MGIGDGVRNVCNSIVGAVIGVFVVGGALFLLGWNEKRAVWTAQTINEARDFEQVDGCTPRPEYNGKLIAFEGCDFGPTNGGHYTADDYLRGLGASQSSAPLTTNTDPVLFWKRTVQSYQREEIKDDNANYTYVPRWLSYRPSYAHFPSDSPKAWPAQLMVTAQSSGVSVCVSSPGNCTSLGGSWQFPWGDKFGGFVGRHRNLPMNQAYQTNLNDTGLVASVDTFVCGDYLQTKLSQFSTCLNPLLATAVMWGDFRFGIDAYVKEKGSVVSGLVKQVYNGATGTYGFEKWQNPKHSSCSYCQIGVVENGVQDGDAILDDLAASNKATTWVLRFVGFFICWLGCFMMMSPIAAVPEMIPIIGQFLGELMSCIVAAISAGFALLLSILVIGIAWLAYRPFIGLPMLALVILGTVALVFAIRKHKKQSKGHVALNEAPGASYGTGAQYSPGYPPQQQYPPQQYPLQQQPYPPQQQPQYPPQQYPQQPYPPQQQPQYPMPAPQV